ncbi:MAG: ABC transporter ATP-binding protein [Bryobacteraceae bacterium]
MQPLVSLDRVSKEYRLGVSQISLPALVADKLRAAVSRSAENHHRGRNLWALRDVSFELARGQCLALIGSNGAGKTTILKLISRITKPTEGVVTTDGMLTALIELGAGFHPDLTGRENIYLNGAILGLSRKYISRHFDEIVAFSGLEVFIDTPIKRYSSGMAVRLGFSVATCVQPDVLLVDEVLAVGDVSFQQKCLKRIRSLVENGTGILFVSHNLYMVQAVCDRALYLKNGCVKSAGTTKEVIDAYEQSIHEEHTPTKSDSTADGESGHSPVTITKVEILPENGAANSHVLSSAEPAVIKVSYHATVDIGPLNMSLFIRRSDGLTCCMIRTASDGHRLWLHRGSGEFSIYIERLQLITGSYSAHAYLLNDSDSLALTPAGRQSEWFMVKGNSLSYAENSGVYEPIVKWSCE